MRSTLLVLAGAVTLGATSLRAQTTLPGTTGTQPPAGVAMPARHHGMRGMLLRGVSLSADQRAQLKAIHTRYRDQRRSMSRPGSAADSASRAAFRAQGRALHEREMADVRNVLTPAQQATFDRNVADWKAQRHARPDGRRAAR